MDKLKANNKAHTVYKLQDGTRIPGATTITGLLAKPYLIKWANDLGLEGIDSTKYRDEAASVGTLAHALVQSNITGEPVDTSAFSPIDVDLAENAVISFLNWKKQHKLKPIICEVPLVSESRRYGGTVDCYCELDGEPTLLDFKTGKAIYDEYFVQLAAYRELLQEHGHPVSTCRILRIGRDETEGFEERTITHTDRYFEVFTDLLDIYYIKRELGWK